MYLKRAILVNWGNIPNIELNFGPVNLFSGGNGSGKTTAADAIQALMTAAHENLFAFNPGQDETTQRGRGGKQVRTLASYLLGCDDGSYARLHGTDGYVVGVFSPTTGEDSEPFTAIMAMRGHLEKSGTTQQARLDELFFAILPNEQLHLHNFEKKDSGGRYVVSLDRIIPSLKKEFSTTVIETYEKKGAYLRRLYAILKGRKDSISAGEAKHAARTFAGFMAYKPVKSIHEFVAREILEPKSLGDAIRTVSDLMKTVHEMEANAAKIKLSVETLAKAKQSAESYTQLWTADLVASYSNSYHKTWQLQQLYLKTKQAHSQGLSTTEELSNKISRNDEKCQTMHLTIVKLEAKRLGIQSLRKKDELEAIIDQCRNRLANSAKPIVMQIQQLHQNIDCATDFLQHTQQHSIGADIPCIEDKAILKLSKAVSQNQPAADLDAYQLLNQDWIDLSPLEQTVEHIIDWQQQQNRWVGHFYNSSNEPLLESERSKSISEELIALVDRRNQQRQKLESEVRNKKQEIQLLSNKQVSYPHHVEQTIKTILELCPEAEPKVLCDYIDVLDERWQMAIEGYIGGARFSIMVDAEHEAEVIKIVRNMRNDRRNKARVIQGRKAQRDAQRCSNPPSSIIELMAFSHHTAKDYLNASYGNVVQVSTPEQLKMTARGITAEGLASGSYAMWRCDINDADLVFGKAARERALKAKELEYETLRLASHSAEENYQQALRLYEVVKRIQPLELAAPVQEMLPLLRDLHQAEEAKHELDFSDSDNLEKELEVSRDTHLELAATGKQYEQELGGLLVEQKQLHLKIKSLAGEQETCGEQKDIIEQAVHAISDTLPRFDAELTLKTADEKVQAEGKHYTPGQDDCSDGLIRIERELFASVQLHNQTAEDIDKLVYDSGLTEPHSTAFFKQIAKLGNIIDSLHNRLKNNILIERHLQLSQLKDSFNTAFVTNLCHSIYQAIHSGKNSLDDLNKELEHHRFGSDRERFYFEYSWVPEYQEYWQFFKTVINTPNLGDGTSLFDADLAPKHARTRDRLLSMLLDKDVDTAHRELSRISDYRNYRRYEIYKQPENKQPIALSQYGTGSGGQLETPAYIIRAAAVTSAFRFNEGKSHLRMVMVDEAFSKMDETRSREVIHYLTNSLGLQLIFIMPTSKSGPFLDIISNQFVYTKCPTQESIGELKTRVLVDRKECNQEQIAELWSKHRKTIRHQAMLDFMEDI